MKYKDLIKSQKTYQKKSYAGNFENAFVVSLVFILYIT